MLPLPHRPWGRKLSGRLLGWLLLFSLLPLFATNTVGYFRSRGIIERLVDRYVGALAQGEAQHVGERVDRHLLSLQAIAAGNDFLAAGLLRFEGKPAGQMGTVADPVALQHFLDDKRKELPVFDALYLFTPDGRVAASSGPSERIITTAPRDTAAPSITTNVDKSRQIPQPQFRLAAPIRVRSATIGYLGGTVTTLGVRDFLQLPEHLAGHVEGYVIDEFARPLFVSHPHSTIDYAAPFASPVVVQPPGTHQHYRNHEGVAVMGTVTTIPGHPWRFIAEVPEADALGELRQLGGLSLALELLLVIVVVSTAWLVSRGMVAPIKRLVAATRRVGGGDLSVRVAIDQHDELGELERAFNDMTSALADTTKRVHELHQREIGRASQLATVGELASGIAHEIKNPVIGVAHGLDLVRRRVGPDPALGTIVDEMSRQLLRIQGTLHELLTFARPATPTLAPVSGNDVVQRAVSLARATAERGGVEIVVDADPALPRFLADEEMLYQAIVNVVMNGLQATPAGGRVTVATRAAGEQIRIIVTDTGHGIPAENLESVFRPFFTTRHTGSGLGLPITREIAQRHGGAVTVESQLGVGTTIIIELPIRHATDFAEQEVLTV